ncbi:hypothetical protein D3C86_1753830 [compost metagenome]
MFTHKLDQFSGSFGACKDLSLADHNVFLKIISRLLRNTEIFHRSGYFNPAFVTNTEEMVNRVTACENDGRMVQDVDFLLAKVFVGNSVDLYEGPEINLDIVLSG